MTEPLIKVLPVTVPTVMQFAVASSSRPGIWHTVSYSLESGEFSCHCEAFSYYENRGLCRHCMAVIRHAAAEHQMRGIPA